MVPTLSKGQKFERIYRSPEYDWIRAVQQTFDSGFIATGQTKSFGAGIFDEYLIKTNAYGDTIWTRTYGGPFIEEGESVIQLSDSGYIICGWSDHLGAGSWDMLVIRTDKNGNLLWSKTYGGLSHELAENIRQTYDNGFIIVGWTGSYGGGDFDFYLTKIDSVGNLLWNRTYGDGFTESGYNICQTNDSGFAMIGITGSYGAGGVDMMIIKTDQTGNVQWSKAYGGTADEWGTSIEQTNDNGFIFAGYNNSLVANYGDILFGKTDSQGNLEWAKSFSGGPKSNGSEGYSILPLSDGYALTGIENFPINAFLIKTDFSGNLIWGKNFGPHSITSFAKTYDGFILGGGTNLFDDYLLIRTDSLGNSSCNSFPFTPSLYSPSLITNATNTGVSHGGISNDVNLSEGPSKPITYDPCFVNNMETLNDVQFPIYPNPSHGNFYISNNVLNPFRKIKIYDVLGNNILNMSSVNQELISFSITAKGFYNIIFETDEKIYMQKLVIN